jgi:periplasmic divalent cation tolerance protein
MTLFVVCTTVASREDATRLARAAVERKLAACVQISAIDSVYTWQGAVHQEPEFRVVFKTAAVRYRELEAMILAMHPYELPAVFALEVSAASAEYQGWVLANSTEGETRMG